MSQYPYAYGQYQGPPPPQQPYSYQATVPYPSSHGYGPQGPPVNSHYTMTQGSYDYNAANIPGLGMASPMPAGPYQPPSAQPWGQPTPVPPQYPPQQYQQHQPPPHQHQPQHPHPHQPPNYQPPSHTPQAHTPTAYQPPPPLIQTSQPSQATQSQPAPQKQTEPSPEPAEEGELSEGEFEDLYEPHDPDRDRRKQAAKAQPTAPRDRPDRLATASAKSDNFYGSGSELGEVMPAKDVTPKHSLAADSGVSPAPQQDTTSSYSPYLSPHEPHKPKPASFVAMGQTPSQFVADIPGLGSATTAPASALAPGATASSIPTQANSLKPRADTPALRQEPSWKQVKQPNYSDLAEARKKAKAAILNLQSFDIKYHHYVEEGLDHHLVKSLFTELGLDTAARPESQQQKSSSTRNLSAMPTLTDPSTSDRRPSASGIGPNKDKPTVAGVSSSSVEEKSESRKDRIARLLAAKKGKGSAPANVDNATDGLDASNAAVLSSQSAQPEKPPVKRKTNSEKDRLLQQKMDALEKSRAERAKKDAERKNSVQAQQTVSQPTSQASTATTDTTPPNISHARSSPAPPSHLASTPQAGPMIPGLYLSTTPQPQSTHRKRPVASDFDSSAPSVPPKRPFGQSRQDSRVTDVSDDEDIEMDMGSPTDPPPGPATRIEPPFRRPNSTGAILRTAERQLGSPVPRSTNTPVGAISANRQEVENDLARRTREIEELKRKIAEAESRKKNLGFSQRDVGSFIPTPQTPPVHSTVDSEAQNRSSTQLEMEPEPAKLPKKPSNLGDLSLNERRDRIVSLHLPRIETTIQDQMKRLKLLEEEAASLRVTIEQNLAEKERLAAEAKQLDVKAKEVPVSSIPVEPAQSALTNGDSGDNTAEQRQPSSQSEGELGSTDQSELSPAESYESQKAVSNSPQASNYIEKPLETKLDTQAGFEDSNSDTGPNASNKVESATPANADTIASQSSAESADMEIDTNLAPEGDLKPASPHSLRDPSEEGSHALTDVDTSDEIEPGSSSGPITDTPNSARSPNAADDKVDPSGNVQDKVETDGNIGMSESEGMDLEEASPIPAKFSTGNPEEPNASDGISKAQSQAAREGPSAPPVVELPSAFVPYESPLTLFKAYRFHPKFSESVPAGLKSLTYSNNINAGLEFCSQELTDGSCDNPNCALQHFASVAAPENQILLELGNQDGYIGERKTEFVNGLKALLQSFKGTPQQKNFDHIAKEILAYRARFNGDSSKVLPLEGVEI